MPGNGARNGADMRRATAVLLLIAVAAVGLRASGSLSSAGNSQIMGVSARVLYWSLAIAELIFGLAGIALLILRLFWARKGGLPVRRKRRSLWWLLLLPLAAVGLSNILKKLRRHALARSALAPSAQHATADGAGHPVHGNPWPLLALFAVVALASVALTGYRRRTAAPPKDDLPSGDDPAPLAAALAAGERALHADPDPRTAIIGCYAAMERSLADAGSPPHLSDTPAEVLSRATAGGLVRPTWAGSLTGLFRRARYSSQPMTEADRAEALGALAQVRAELGDAP
jgi:hypothetical protein